MNPKIKRDAELIFKTSSIVIRTKKLILIIAKNERQARWLAAQAMIPKNRWRYISEPDQLRGMVGNENVEIIMMPEWYEGKKSYTLNLFDYILQRHDDRITNGE